MSLASEHQYPDIFDFRVQNENRCRGHRYLPTRIGP